MKYFVYLLFSKNTNRGITYVGYTNNITKRLKLHNTSRGAKFTKGRIWHVIYKKTYYTKSEAMKNEYVLKKDIKKRLFLKNKYLNKIQ
ncbi:GIY-YIG nuclease family protein [Candidatus Pelagibacter sp.]|nr:GIY-YIG nuclease family protein [Candidatus Pelagibacter sp.]